MKKALFIIIGVLVIDQAVKFWVKTNMFLGQEFHILGDWFIIHFTENEGMAFGWILPGEYGKLVLSLFRIVAVGAIGWYLYDMIRKKADAIVVVSIALIFAGAVGNIIDSAFYGLLFSESYGEPATFLPPEGGYAGLLHGRVVDMLYFPLFDGHFPEWLPIWGGEHFLFFRPVFNIADSSITIGVALILIFQKRFFKQEEEKRKKAEEAKQVDAKSDIATD